MNSGMQDLNCYVFRICIELILGEFKAAPIRGACYFMYVSYVRKSGWFRIRFFFIVLLEYVLKTCFTTPIKKSFHLPFQNFIIFIYSSIV